MKKKSVEFRLKAEKQDFPIMKIRTSKDIYEYTRQFYVDDINIYESTFVILLNQVGNTIGYAKISQGGVTGTVVDTRIVAKYAIESLSTAIVLVHNHPSGNLVPSRDDNNLTNRVKDALGLFNITLLDHLIVTEDAFYSYHDEGKL